ncbi:MAG: prepilin-type N-terminal cleavage/methylation domain-containing protein [Candidatus Omnitrophica bacterium]|nr:prepilin-type N-terminal cleavage/methylation domain-containing protein [Candidatus Omnitrophota bacterium]
MSNPLKKENGITLVEVLFSAVILAMVITGILFIFVQTLDMSKRIDHEYTATNLATARMERARTVIESSGFDYLTDLRETDTIIDETGGQNPNGEFNRSTTVTPLDTNRTQFEVVVIYKYRGNWKDNASVTLTTIFSTIQ